MSASGGKAVVSRTIFDSNILNVCFSQKRPFRAEENHENEGQLTARSRRRFHCSASLTIRPIGRDLKYFIRSRQILDKVIYELNERSAKCSPARHMPPGASPFGLQHDLNDM